MNKKALRDAQAAESKKRKSGKSGSVIVHFERPVHHVPWWRRAKDADYATVYFASTFQVQGDSIQIQSLTDTGKLTRVLNWRNVESIVAVPALPETEETD